MNLASRSLVSVVVPVYNVQDYLDACLESIRQQTYPNLEIIVVEDGSTDGSLQALESHLSDARVRLIRHERNSGLSAARNTGIEAARGDYILFVDSDDLLEPDLVQACIECALANNADLVLFDFSSFQDGEKAPLVPLDDTAPPTLLPRRDTTYFQLPQFAWLKFVSSKLIHQHGLRFPVGYYYEDAPFHWELGLHAERVFHLNRRYYRYRQRGTSITGSRGRKLFHQFAVQLLIAELLDKNQWVPGAVESLATKIHRSIWFVATWVADDLLEEALIAVRHHLKVTRDIRLRSRPNAKTAILIMLVRLPRPLALASIRALRSALAISSPSRRTAGRDAGTAQPSST
jgi:glycosyltransferase involved in cell wall biosynthesis